uniref:Uncharacterized protein n=1 Tax=Oryza punctata TaxID=4537 RepID=A0A0E0KU55_ORYPU
MVSKEEPSGEPCSVMHESKLVLTFAAFRGRCSPTAACCCCTIADLPKRDGNEEAWIEKRKGRDKFKIYAYMGPGSLCCTRTNL